MTSTNLAAMQQGRTAVAVSQMRPKDQIAHFLNEKKSEIAKMLPKHLNAERLLKVAQIAATTTPTLLKCDVPSLVGAIGQCAQMGLEPNTVLGHAYLVPFNTKRKDANGAEKWVNSVQVIIGYKGLIDLARRSGQIISIAAHEVCEKDHFELVYGLDEKLNHTPCLGERGAIIGFYAVAKLKDGGHSCEFMSRRQVEEIMVATQSKGKYGPWKDHFPEMGRKTVIRRLAKYLPLSIEFQTAVALDGMADGGKDQHLDAIDGDFNLLPDDAPQSEGFTDPDTGEITAHLSDDAQVDLPATATAHAEKDAKLAAAAPTKGLSFAKVADSLEKATDADVLDVAADLIDQVEDQAQRDELVAIYTKRKEQFLTAAAAPKRARANITAE